jgi:hypothetical protein
MTKQVIRSYPPSVILKAGRELWVPDKYPHRNQFYTDVARAVTKDPAYLVGNSERKFLKEVLFVITWRDHE